MNHYQRIIIATLNCDAAMAARVEDIMRHVVFHSTLDWQSKEELQRGAREALEVIRELDALPSGEL